MKKLKFKTDIEANTIGKKIIFYFLVFTVIGYLLFFNELYAKYKYSTYYENKKIFKKWLKENKLPKPIIYDIYGGYCKKWYIDGYNIYYNKRPLKDYWFISNKKDNIVLSDFVSGKYDTKLYNEIKEVLKCQV